MPANHTDRGEVVPNGASSGTGIAERGLLKERAYADIKRLILNSEFAPGSFLAERQLAARLGMSKTPVRSALERLEAEGFLSISPQQGAIVRDLSLREIADHYEIRAAIESFVARTLAGKLAREQTVLVRASLDEQKANLAAKDVARAVELDERFHTLFWEFLGNQEILRVMTQLRDKTHRLIFQAFTINPARLVCSYTEHRGIAEAVFKGHAALAARRVEEHLQYGKESLLAPRQR
jgi:DNA-binding GntR family transcriptional regulator